MRTRRGFVLALATVLPHVALAQSSSTSSIQTISPVQGAATYRGGTIATGGTSQQLMDVNTNRRGWNFQNQSTSMCFLKIGAAATMDNVSLRISPGGFYETPSSHVSTGAINVTCALTGAAFYSTEW